MDRNISSQKEYNLKLNFKKMGESASKLTESDLEMLHRISKKPKEEILFWYEHFLKECPTGKLDKQKFVEFYKLFRKNEKNVEEIAELCFYAFDNDKNGYVDFSEFLIAYATTNGTDVREKLEYVFQIYDRDNNKVLDEAEIKFVLKSMFKLLNVSQNSVDFDRCLRNIMISLDANKDSKISKAEFIEGILNDAYLYALLSPFS